MHKIAAMLIAGLIGSPAWATGPREAVEAFHAALTSVTRRPLLRCCRPRCSFSSPAMSSVRHGIDEFERLMRFSARA